MSITVKKKNAWNYTPPNDFIPLNMNITNLANPQSRTISDSKSAPASIVVRQKVSAEMKSVGQSYTRLYPMVNRSARGASSDCRYPSVYFVCVSTPNSYNLMHPVISTNAEEAATSIASPIKYRPGGARIVYHGQTSNMKNRIESYMGDFTKLFKISRYTNNQRHLLLLERRSSCINDDNYYIPPSDYEVVRRNVSNAMTRVLSSPMFPPVFCMEYRVKPCLNHILFEKKVLSSFVFIANVSDNKEHAKPTYVDGKIIDTTNQVMDLMAIDRHCRETYIPSPPIPLHMARLEDTQNRMKEKTMMKVTSAGIACLSANAMIRGSKSSKKKR